MPAWRAWATTHPLASAVALAVAVRCALALMLPIGATYDIDSYRIVAETVARHQDVYSAAQTVHRYPYLPLHVWLVSGFWWLSSWLPLPFVTLVKLPAIAADAGIVALIFRALERRHGEYRALIGARLYALSPVAIAITAVHGQFDAIPLLCLLLCLYWLTFKADARRDIALAGVFLGMGILDKTWPLLFALPLVAMLPWRRWPIFAGAAALPSLAGIGLYLAIFPHALAGMVERVAGYHSLPATFGFTAALALVTGEHGALYVAADRFGFVLTMLAIGVVGLLMARWKQAPELALLASMVTFFALSAGFGIQYLVWLVPVAILASQGVWLRRYTLACLPWLVIAYGTFYTLPILQRLTSDAAAMSIMQAVSLPAWFIVLAWAVTILRRQPIDA